MLGVFCSRTKPIHVLLSLSHTSQAAHHHRLAETSVSFVGSGQRRRHSCACRLGLDIGGCASIWHAILPSSSGGGGAGGGRCHRPHFHRDHDQMKGEGSWNVAWDARPARWLHHSDSAWLLFGVCACLAAPIEYNDVAPLAVSVVDGNLEERGTKVITFGTDENSVKYRVTGVKADGRCLFRAVAHGACLKDGEEAPDENRQRELADDLRAQVVDELCKRRKETEWSIEEDFDTYISRIQQPYIWGGEHELLMASHVLRTPISVFMVNKSSGSLIKIANYGDDYRKDKENSITILFHGYGHYDILEAVF